MYKNLLNGVSIWYCRRAVVAMVLPRPPLRDRSRVVPRSDSACVFTERERSENSGFTKSRRVIGEHVSHPLVGWRTSDQDGWGLRSNLICRGIFEDFHAGSKGNLSSKIATPRPMQMLQGADIPNRRHLVPKHSLGAEHLVPRLKTPRL